MPRARMHPKPWPPSRLWSKTSSTRSSPRLFQRKQIFDQVHQLLLGHALFQAGRHDRELLAGALCNATLRISRDYASDRLEGDFGLGFADNQAVSLAAVFEIQLPRFV